MNTSAERSQTLSASERSIMVDSDAFTSRFDVSKINLLNITTVELARSIRIKCPGVGIRYAYMLAEAIKQAHDMGVTRGKALK